MDTSQPFASLYVLFRNRKRRPHWMFFYSNRGQCVWMIKRVEACGVSFAPRGL